MNTNKFCEITPELKALASRAEVCARIDSDLYARYDVKRGLRDLNGKGVLVGLTEISEVCSTKMENGEAVPADGELFYRGYNVKDLIAGMKGESHFGFEECTYLLLFGKLPTMEELNDFSRLLGHYRTLPTSFVRDIIMKAPSRDMMNTLARSVLTLYSYDDLADDVSIPNVLRQCLQLISLFPLLSVYGYQAYKHYHDGASLFIHSPKAEYSTAENILHVLRADSRFTRWRRSFWILRLCFIWSMAAVITPPLPRTWSHPPAPIPILSCRTFSRLAERTKARRGKYQGGKDV